MHNLAIIAVDDLKAFVAENHIKNEVWNTKQASEYLKCSPTTVKKYAESGVIPGAKVGSDWRFSSIALFKYVAKEERSVANDN